MSSSRKGRTGTVLATLALFACGGGGAEQATSEAPLADTCRVRLGPRATPVAPPVMSALRAPSRPSSRLVAHVDLKVASLVKELEGAIPPRLAEERNRKLGVAGHLDFAVDRGPFRITVEGDALVVRTDVEARARVCSGSRCYASCEPQGRATASVPLRLTPDYRFAPSRVTFAFTRGCVVSALGGMVKIDVTRSIEPQLTSSLRRVEQEIDRKLPLLRPQAERLWTELGKSRPIPLGGCVVAAPRGVVQGPVTGTPAALRVRFGLVAYPEVRSRCGEPPAARPLPPLTQEPTLQAEDDLVLALVSPLTTTAAGLTSTEPFDAGGAKARIARAAAVPSGAAAQIELDLRGEACGELGVRSPLGWADDGSALRLLAPAFAPEERERLTKSALEPDTLAHALGSVRFAPLLAPSALKELLPTIAAGMSDPSVEVLAKVSAVEPLDVFVRGDDVVASLRVRGSVALMQR